MIDNDAEAIESNKDTETENGFGNFTGAIIIGEPLKESLASSEAERQKINEWIGNTFRDRLNSGVWPIVILNEEKEK